MDKCAIYGKCVICGQMCHLWANVTFMGKFAIINGLDLFGLLQCAIARIGAPLTKSSGTRQQSELQCSEAQANQVDLVPFC